jgi:tetratricopeptide (TPR) repeat protein
MSAGNAADTNTSFRRTGIFSIVGILLLLLHWAVSFDYSNWFWGFNHYVFLPVHWVYILVSLGCVLCLPWIAMRALTFHEYLAGRLSTSRLSRRILDIAVVGALGTLFWYLRASHHLLGDGNLLIRVLGAGSWFHPHETLDHIIHHVVFTVANSWIGWDAETVYAVLSVGAGITYAIASMRLGSFLGQKLLVPALLLTLGTVVLFMGYVESYSLATAAILVYMVLALQHTNGKRRVIWPAVALITGVALHHAVAFMVPSLLYLLLSGPEGAVARSLKSAIWAGVLALIVAAILSTSWLSQRGGLSLMIVPLSLADISQYTLLSWKHLVDFTNEQVLVSPLGWIAAAFFTAAFFRTKALRQSRRFRFLFVAAVFPFVFSLLLRPGLGGSRDWDLWSLGTLPYIVAATCWLAYGLCDSQKSRYGLYIITVVGFFHILPWIAVNHSAELSLRHFRSMLVENPLWTSRRIAAGRAELAWLHSQQSDYAEAIRQIEEAITLAPEVGRYWRGLGTYYFHEGRIEQSESCLRKAIDLDPRDAASHSKLGQLYALQGRLADAESLLKKAVEIDPDLAHAYFSLGILYEKQGNATAAREAYLKATEVRPLVALYWYNLAKCLSALSDDEEVDAWRNVLRLTEKQPSYDGVAEEARMNLRRLSQPVSPEAES